jgi:hypothetical protein
MFYHGGEKLTAGEQDVKLDTLHPCVERVEPLMRALVCRAS